MSGFKMTIEQAKRLSHLQVDLDELTTEVMFSQGIRMCPFKECERDNKESIDNTQQPKAIIALDELELSIESFTTNVLHSVCDSEHTLKQFIKYLRAQHQKELEGAKK